MSRFFTLSSLLFSLIRKILFFWVRSEINGADQDSLQLDPSKPVIYVLQYRSFSSRLVLENACIRSSLPSSQQKLLLAGDEVRRSFFFLYEPLGRWLRRKQRPVVTGRLKQIVTDMGREEDCDVQLVPVSIFWGRSPMKEKSWLQLLFTDSRAAVNPLRRLFTIILHGRRTYVQFSKPMSLRELYNDTEQDPKRTERKTARILRVHFRRVSQTVLGPDLSHRHTLVNDLVQSPAVRAVIQEQAKSEEKDIKEIEDLARKYGDEIAANLQISTIHFLERMLNRLWNKIYKGITAKNVDMVREITKDHAVVYVPCHRSHIDYLLLSSLLFAEGIMVPHIAAGINLNLPIVGSILRRGGAFFMRRSFKGNKLYATLFSEYIHTMFKKGYSIEYFVEGGRSRTGRTLQPKAGMVAMTVSSYLRDQQKPIALIPVYFGYEKVLEGGAYLGELRGKEKQKESVFGLFKSLKNLRKSFGKVAVNFGEPIVLGDYMSQQQPGWKDDLNESYDPEIKPAWFNKVVADLSLEITTRINSSVSLNPVNLTALILLATNRQAMDAKELATLTTFFAQLIEKAPYSDFMSFAEGDGFDWIEYTEAMGLLHRQENSLGDIISLTDRNAILLTYNRNNILHLFAIPALIASLVHNNPVIKRTEVHRLFRSVYPYIRSELFLLFEGDEVDAEFDRWLKQLEESGLISLEGENITRPALGTTAFLRLSVLSRFIMPTLERYYIAIAVLTNHGSGKLNAKELEQKSTMMAERMSILFGLNAPEFFDKALFRNFISTLKDKHALTETDEGMLDYDAQVIQVVNDAELVMNAELRHSVLQATAER
jgi:glycerol-3-phosphate O-acyltransferase